MKEEPVHIFDINTLQKFYSELFPAQEFFEWLTYAHGDNLSKKEDFLKRELSFTLSNDVYIRYRGYKDAESLRADLVRLNPVKIDIGGVYNMDMSHKGESSFYPLSRELIFDIDMDDYSPIRHCCEGANICPNCWKFMNNAMVVLNKILKNEFGFKNILFVYSGRRGVHIWVCDERARRLTDEQRSAIVNYISFSQTSMTMDYSLLEAAEQLREFFETHIIQPEGQDVLRYDPSKDHPTQGSFLTLDNIINRFHDQRFLPLLHCIHDLGSEDLGKLVNILTEKKYGSHVDPLTKWRDIEALLTNAKSNNRYKDHQDRREVQKIILTYTYPRIDRNVSLLRHHLLKSPFIVHPKSCRFCCPINPDSLLGFDPFTVPYLDQVFEDPNAMEVYKGYVEMFRSKFLRPLREDIEKKEKMQGSGQMSSALDF